jgi:membrane protease YdiL (CAAX protease family)
MNFLDVAKQDRSSIGLYLGGISLLIVLYILGNVPMLLDIKLNFPGLLFDPENPGFIASYGSLRLLVGVLFPFVCLFVGLACYLRFAHQRKWLHIFTAASAFRWKRFFAFGSILLVLFTIIAFGEAYLTGQTAHLYWNYKPERFFPLLGVSLLMVPLQAAAEELIFRVYALQGLFIRTKSVWLSVVFSSIFFALVHISNPEISSLGPALLLYYLMAGLFLALLTIQDDGLELALAFHVFNNLFGVLLFSTDWQVFHTEALFLDQRGPGSLSFYLLGSLLLFSLLYFVLAKIFGWKPLRTLR